MCKSYVSLCDRTETSLIHVKLFHKVTEFDRRLWSYFELCVRINPLHIKHDRFIVILDNVITTSNRNCRVISFRWRSHCLTWRQSAFIWESGCLSGYLSSLPALLAGVQLWPWPTCGTCGLSFSRSQPDSRVFLRVLRFSSLIKIDSQLINI